MEDGANNRIAALDGWRGIAILLVLADHLQRQWRGSDPWVYTGQHGVTLFFVLSGFLITSNLLKSPDLKTFYVRRLFRLMPVAWAYLAFISVIGMFFPLSAMSPLELTSCLLFFKNYIFHPGYLIPNHFWSLSIEEQFYLAWPATLLLLRKHRALWWVTSVGLASAVFRSTHLAQYNILGPCFRTEVRVDALCVGCMLALFLTIPRFNRVLQISLDYLYPVALIIVVICIFTIKWLPPLYECCAMAVLISGPLARPDRLYSKALAISPLTYLGVISYSLYVWLGFFTMHFDPVTQIFLDLLYPCLALGSYYLIERPCTAAGKRISFERQNRTAPLSRIA